MPTVIDSKLLADRVALQRTFMTSLQQQLQQGAPAAQLQQSLIARTQSMIAAVTAARDRAVRAYDAQVAELLRQLTTLQAAASAAAPTVPAKKAGKA